MSDKAYWRDKLDFIRREDAGIDPTTLQKVFQNVKVLEDEPCDLAMRARKQGQQTPSGTVYNMIREPILKIWPNGDDGILKVPDEDDDVLVNGSLYKVIDVETYVDGATGDYRGSRLLLRATEKT